MALKNYTINNPPKPSSTFLRPLNSASTFALRLAQDNGHHHRSPSVSCGQHLAAVGTFADAMWVYSSPR